MLRRLCIVSLALVFGAVVGWFISSWGFLTLPSTKAKVPPPYLVPKVPGGTALSLAMVHDVLHERYVRPGPAYYQERNRRIQQELAMTDGPAADPKSLRRLELMNDLAVGQYAVGEYAPAVVTLLNKRKLQSEVENQWQGDPAHRAAAGAATAGTTLTPQRRELYRTYANLGTFLILDSLREGLAENPTSRKKLDEGTYLIREAILLDPESHFGREKWQLVILEFLQAVCDQPMLLLEYDMVGNRLDAAFPGHRLTYQPGWIERWRSEAKPNDTLEALRKESSDPNLASLRAEIRDKYITKVGAEAGWSKAVPSVHQQPVPFDEPALAIVGMWMIGGGPNPFFAVALGGIMERVGQHELAWEAYQRAESMAKFVWPDAKIQEGFAAHCQRRKAHLEGAIAEELGLPLEQMRAALTAKYEAELKRGRDDQKAYHDFEAAQVAAGIAPGSPDFYKPFLEKHGPIASPAATYDAIDAPLVLGIRERWPAVFAFAGLATLAAGLWFVPTKEPSVKSTQPQ